MIALTDILKLSEADLSWLLPGASVEESLLHFCQFGPALVIVTQGEKGAVAARCGSAKTIRVPGVPVSVIDTVGAGDSFGAGVLAWLADRSLTARERVLALPEPALREVLSFATVVAALNCARAGANPPRRSEVEQFIAR